MKCGRDESLHHRSAIAAALGRHGGVLPALPHATVEAAAAYAHDILTWLRFLKERRGGKTVRQADRGS